MKFDLYADAPIKSIEFDVVDDGEPSQQIDFKVQQGADGRWFHGFIFKATVNGTWPLRIRAWDSRNVMGSTICRPGVTVTL